MKLIEALRIVNDPGRRSLPPFRVLLACGFSPLHLQTFLTAHLQQRLPGRYVVVTTGLYGDWLTTVQETNPAEHDAVLLPLEWADWDTRLGLRTFAGWGPAQLESIAANVALRCRQLEEAWGETGPVVPVALSLPTLPFPPIAHTAPWQSSAFELRLRGRLQEFAAAVVELPRVQVLRSQVLDLVSPLGGRGDLAAEWKSGFPYTLAHADALAGQLALLLAPPAPKKGLITDLDNTFWQGIVGEVGADGVGWTLDDHAPAHGAYQQLLGSLAASGVLVAVASKNDPAVVKTAFARTDLVMPADQVFPLEVHWEPKSGSVARILDAWNVGPESVVFVDDSPLELAEVKAAHPAIECLTFPENDPAACARLFEHLRALFGRTAVREEDRLRRESLRRGQEFQSAVQTTSPDDFLRGIQAELDLTLNQDARDARAWELVNKTNQFNLNGRRYDEAAWQRAVTAADAFLLTTAYRDTFGPLGKIGVLLGHRERNTLVIDAWVLSCRAFARRIEWGCLAFLLAHFGAEAVRFDFAPTPKNGPLQTFLATLSGGAPAIGMTVSREQFQAVCPPLAHTVLQSVEEPIHG